MNKSFGLPLNWEKKVALLIFGALLFMEGVALCGEEGDKEFLSNEKKYVMEWRKERDQFFKTHQRSPLVPAEKEHAGGRDEGWGKDFQVIFQ
jgi:hypothetical protein